MDCRGPFVLAVGLIVGVCGCIPSSTLPTQPANDMPTGEPTKESHASKRPPRPATCISLARLYEEGAAEPTCQPAQRDALLDRARKCYQQALTTDPKNHDALVGLARLYNLRADYARAASTYGKATQLYPKEAGLWFEFGMCQGRSKEWDAAAASLRSAVELDGENRLYVHSLGFALVHAGRYDDAFAAFRKVDVEAEAHYNLARMLRHMDQPELCKEHLTMALQRNPQHTKALELLQELQNPQQQPVTQAAQAGK